MKKIMQRQGGETLDVDFSEGAEFQLNLDQVNHLPFEDGEFEAVVALDCLEHIENFHFSFFSELVRCASKTVIVSLPVGPYEVVRGLMRPQNSFRNRDSEGVFSKYYGLPPEKVLDRHRWFLWVEDIVRIAMKLKDENPRVTAVKPMTRKRKE